MITVKHIKSLDGLKDLIFEQTYNESIDRMRSSYFYRGMPTRLLDWTHSTLVALHFANTEDNLDMLSQRDCVVWRIDLRDLNRNLPEKPDGKIMGSTGTGSFGFRFFCCGVG